MAASIANAHLGILMSGTWNAYKNRYWPHRYVINPEGSIIFDHIGEGKYAETEEVIKNSIEKDRIPVEANSESGE